MARWSLAACMTSVMLLSACQEKEPILQGPRFDLRDMDEAVAVASDPSAQARAEAQARNVTAIPTRTPIRGYSVSGEARSLGLEGARTNSDWPQRNGSAQHRITHPALGANLTEVWSTSIGKGNGKRVRMTATPVVAGGRIFTMDSHSDVRAHALNGGLLWQQNLTPSTERRGEASGGGFAVSGNRLYVTTGYGRLYAMDVASGAIYWQQDLDAVPSAAPTVSDGLVYLTSRDGTAWAIDASDGKTRWQLQATGSGSYTIGGSSPAITSRAAIFPFGSGELLSVLKRGGVRLWGTTISGERLGYAYAGVTDISSDPVVVGNTIYVGNPGGRLVALDATSGERRWTAREGASSPVWPAGNSLFLISDRNELIRLNAATGERIWGATLTLYTREKVSKRQGVFAHYGPILAGGRLITVSSDGYMRQVDPTSGQILRQDQLSAPAALDPVVAGGVLYVVTADGKLHAFR
ncbi:PQQ-binding-like beta-propeller repeat protein [Qingshengfaniella alkalisoli]|uniref:PQQ-binding-like beta-propeller repeat protein n=2 Tax=Qingshengfaniella alkalisoli TaxID=2599296 RepID=A0A5B8I8U8_9RHOB|nr:PQQ-binding-like beta-propeller repeat protein [Qingshengfaniella alkalisoli]